VAAKPRIAAGELAGLCSSRLSDAALSDLCWLLHNAAVFDTGILTSLASRPDLGKGLVRFFPWGDATSSLGDARSSLRDAKSSLGDATSSLGDAKSSLGDAKSSQGDAKSSLGDAKSSQGNATSSLGDAKSSLGDATSSLGDAKSSLGDAKSSQGDATSSLGDAKSSVSVTAGAPLCASCPQESSAPILVSSRIALTWVPISRRSTQHGAACDPVSPFAMLQPPPPPPNTSKHHA
jgi:uncharacterized protein YjbJ (UPF0337 family)